MTVSIPFSAPTANAGPMKVMIVCAHYGPPWNEGVKNLVRVLHQQLGRRGIEARVFAGNGVQTGLGAEAAGIRLRFWARAARAARREGVDVIHLMSSITSIAGLKTFVLRRLSGVPVVAHFTGRGAPLSGYRLLHAADRVLVGGDYLLPYFQGARSIPPLTPYVSESGAPPPAPAGPPRRILWLGAMEEVRGVHNLIGALALLRDRHGVDDFTLTLAWNGYGEPGYDERIRGLIRANGLEDRVRWETGSSDVPALYRGHDLLVVPRVGGQRMAFPLRLIEAMSHGRPVVVSDMGEMPRVVEGCGLVYPRGDEPALADALRRLLTDPSLYARCARGALERAREYAPSRTVDSIIETYREVVHAHQR